MTPDPINGELSLPQILRSEELTYEEKAISALSRMGLRHEDDEELRTAAIVFAILAVSGDFR